MRVLFVFIVIGAVALAASGAAYPTPPLVCTERTDAVALIAAACQQLVNCRFDFGAGDAALSLSAWDVLLTEQSGLLSYAATTVLENDARLDFTLNQSLITTPLMAYDADDGGAVDCGALIPTVGASLPVTVVAAINVLSLYQNYMSDVAHCPDVNQVPLWTNASGVPTISCQCAPGKTCEAGNANVSALVGLISIFLVVIASALTVFVMVTSTIDLRTKFRARAKLYQRQQQQQSRGGGGDEELVSLRPQTGVGARSLVRPIGLRK